MVCYRDEDGPFPTTVADSIAKKQTFIQLTPSKKVEAIISEICRQSNYSPNEIDVSISTKSGMISLNNCKDKTMQDLGVQCSDTTHNTIMVNAAKELPEDDLLLGASASPIGGDMPSSICDREYPEMLMSDEDYGAHSSTSKAYLRPVPIETINYVGLVNQAMTCYLNSLLQALYMTPEFRNALYNWEFDGVKETRSIPYQLQKLFLNLQTSKRSAVETTDLTTSFGWHGSDAWQQHDIQELCRVMFDALEKKFSDTKQANLINDLYEGKMLDYVKCLDCGTEKSREDTFLDIPLPVRPFGSNVAYNSVEEALRGFVQPETLDGNNQYHCEKCNKKCDAHKGLKFTKFPYLLTLHLKRFDFDYNAMHRIKLNDKVVFPEKLNLNSFITNKLETDSTEEREHTVRCDDCSTTDSGSALDDESCQGTDVSSTINGQDDNCADSDEGIDVSSGNNMSENDAKGPYVYELFSIMIHSGSASGGHYYAYIKDFDKNQWFCFNDQSVTRITEDDIRKTYGGGPHRGYYSGVYSSSTNAYMLMYRQIDKDRNAKAMSVEGFPPHIKHLLLHMQEKEEQDRINREKEKDIIKLIVYCFHPTELVLQDCKIATFIDATLSEAAAVAHQRFKLNGIVAMEECRLVTYNKKRNCIDCSFESDELKFCDIESRVAMLHHGDWMLEIRAPGAMFETYKQDGINMKVYPVNLETGEIEDLIFVRVNVDDTVRDLRLKLANILNKDLQYVKVALDMFYSGPKILGNDSARVFEEFDTNCYDYKLLVANGVEDEAEKFAAYSKFQKILMKMGNVMIFQLAYPETDLDTLEMLSIPPLDMNQNHDASGDRGTNSPVSRVSPQPGLCIDGLGDQSNSEDSSLSDSDRTLVGEAPGDCPPPLMSSNSNSPADQHMASPVDPAEDDYNYEVFGKSSLDDTWYSEQMMWDDGDQQQDKPTNQEKSQDTNRHVKTFKDYYFRITNMTKHYSNDPTESHMNCCTVHLDGRMTLKHFKQHLEPVLKVPMAYFKVYRRFQNTDEEWPRLEDSMKVAKDEDHLILKLGRVRRYDEFLCKVYYFKPDILDHTRFLFERIIAKGQTVGQVKKEILNQAQKQNLIDNIPYNRCRLREKSWKRPRKVFLDDQKFDLDIFAPITTEIYLQELNEPEKVMSSEQLVLFVRQWCPSTLTLKPFQEVVLDTTTMDELKKKISELSSIPIEFVEVAPVKSSFPCDIHILGIQKDLEWNLNGVHYDQYSLTAIDGNVFFYRDSREAMKELTPDERKEITLKENTRLGRYGTKTYSPGRETALKIYLDASPCKTDDNCID